MSPTSPCPKTDAAVGIRWLRRISHPAAILPIAFVTALWFGSYSPQEITELQRVPLPLQGSTDMGGSSLFAATMALYFVFGVLGSFYLTVSLADLPASRSWLGDVGRALWILKLHIATYVLGGTANLAYDSRVTPNDFRNMFLLATLLYGCSILLVVALRRMELPLVPRLVVAPAFLYLWLVLGSDGTTAKAGQILQSGRDPVVAPRGLRHRTMLAWHAACDSLLGMPASAAGRPE